MSESAPEAPAAPAQEQQPPAEQPPASPPTVEELQAKLEETTKEARKWEARSKENHQAKTELEKQRQAAMTDAERAVVEAEQRGRTAAATEYGTRLARTEFDALAGRRNADFDTAQALEYVDMKKFLDDNGEPDSKAIKAAVERLVPEAAQGTPSFDGGSRTSTVPQDFNQALRQAAGRA